jgi:hypothetical protein
MTTEFVITAWVADRNAMVKDDPSGTFFLRSVDRTDARHSDTE